MSESDVSFYYHVGKKIAPIQELEIYATQTVPSINWKVHDQRS